jgi:hypothetical protein
MFSRCSLTAALLAAVLLPLAAGAAGQQRTLNNGMLILEDIPEIPQDIADDLARYQNVRSAAFRDWRADGRSFYVATRFGEVDQLHLVRMAGGARQQVTFFGEPIGRVARRRSRRCSPTASPATAAWSGTGRGGASRSRAPAGTELQTTSG